MAKSTGQRTHYIKVAVMLVALALAWQIPGAALATDSWDRWNFRVIVDGKGTYIAPQGPGDYPSPAFHAAFNFHVTTQVFQFMDGGVDPFEETILLWQPLDWITGSCSGEYCIRDCFEKFEAAVVQNGHADFIEISVYKFDLVDRFFFVFRLSPGADCCGWWTPGECYKDYCFPWLAWGFPDGLKTNNCKDVVIPIDYNILKSKWEHFGLFQGSMDADCLKQATGQTDITSGASLTWNATITIEVLSYTPFGKPTKMRPRNIPLSIILLH